MPNWCAGNIRFRGKMDDIIKLLSNVMVFCAMSNELDENGELKTDERPASVHFDKDFWIIDLVPPKEESFQNGRSWLWIKGTHRNFLDEEESVKTVQCPDSDKYIVIFDGFKAAWSIDSDPYVEMSKKYNVDIRIRGWEQGVGLEQDIEIVGGNIFTNNKDVWANEDWNWKVAMPYLGG